jgi:hypothetical protein
MTTLKGHNNYREDTPVFHRMYFTRSSRNLPNFLFHMLIEFKFQNVYYKRQLNACRRFKSTVEEEAICN